MGNAYRCDGCETTVKEQEAISWLEVQIVGIDVRTHDSPPFTGYFCSPECLSNHYNKLLANRARMGVPCR